MSQSFKLYENSRQNNIYDGGKEPGYKEPTEFFQILSNYS